MQEIQFIKFFPKNIYLKACSASFPRARSASFLISTLNSFQSMLKSATTTASDFILIDRTTLFVVKDQVLLNSVINQKAYVL